MNSYYIHGEDIPPDIDRSLLINIFKPFGKIQKIYINPENTWFKIYFESLDIAEAALSVSGQPPYHLQLSIKKENFTSKKQPVGKAPSVSETNSTMSYDEDEFYGSLGSDYYNIHGIAVSTLRGDDGTVYVPLHEVKQVGFELFEDSDIPSINFTKQMLDEFKLYLTVKARKYILRMRCTIPDNKIEEIKNEVLNEYVNSGTARNVNMSRQIDNNMNTSSTSSLQSLMSVKVKTPPKLPQSGGYTGQKNNKNYSSGRTKPAAQTEFQQPLRRPATTIVNDTPRSSTSSGGQEGGRTKCASPRNENTPNRRNHLLSNPEKENVNSRTQGEAVIKRVELPLNKPVQVTVSFIESQNICWAFKESDRDKLEKLLFETNMEATKQSCIKPVVGQICAATYRGTWYRAIVQKIIPEIKVQFIDFGNFNDEKVVDIRDLPAKITTEPVLAVKLHFTTPPTTKLEDNAELKIIASKRNQDGSYQVEEVSEKPDLENQRALNATPAGKMITNTKAKALGNKPVKKEIGNNSTEKQNSGIPSELRTATDNLANQTKTLTERVANLTLKEKLRNMPHPRKELTTLNPERKCIADLLRTDTSGVVQFTERIDDNTCIVFTLAEDFMNDLASLEKIQPDTGTAMDFAGKVGDTVSVYKEDGETWVRGTIIYIKNNKYVVALVDYGKIITVAKVCRLEKEFESIPEFVCLISGKKECIDLLQQSKEESFTSNEQSKITLSFNDVFYNMNCRRWDPFVTSSLAKKVAELPVFTSTPRLKEVKDGERVLIVTLSDGKLLVRNKETNSLMTRINEQISSYTAPTLTQDPIVNQLVLCPHDTQTRLCRGVIKTINNGYVDVDFIDFGFTDTVPIKKLMSINEDLATECCSLIPITLKGFEDGQFSDEAVEFIEEYCKDAKKLITKKCANNVFDLFTLDGSDRTSISTKLMNLTATKPTTTNNRLMYSDIRKWEIVPGQVENLMCVNIEDNYITFIPDNDIKLDFIELNEKIAKYTDTNTQPYSPIIDELCLAKFEDEWYRAKVQSVNVALEEYDVYYIDYGNTAKVPSMEIREMPKDFASKVPALAILGYLTETLNNKSNPNIIEKIKEEIEAGDCYNVKIIRKMEEDNSYEINIPELTDKLRNILDF